MPTTTTITYEVTSIERASLPAVRSLFLDRDVFPERAGWDARVTVRTPAGAEVGTLHFDRIDGETVWHCSASFTAGCSMPRFMHGLFSRCTIPQVAGPEVAAILDEAAAGSGDWECYGCGHRIPSLTEGFDTRCPRCGSFELHLSDEAKAREQL